MNLVRAIVGHYVSNSSCYSYILQKSESKYPEIDANLVQNCIIWAERGQIWAKTIWFPSPRRVLNFYVDQNAIVSQVASSTVSVWSRTESICKHDALLLEFDSPIIVASSQKRYAVRGTFLKGNRKPIWFWIVSLFEFINMKLVRAIAGLYVSNSCCYSYILQKSESKYIEIDANLFQNCKIWADRESTWSLRKR